MHCFYPNKAKDFTIIKFIKVLLKDNGMTIKGVKKILSLNKKLDYTKLDGLSADYYKIAKQVLFVLHVF